MHYDASCNISSIGFSLLMMMATIKFVLGLKCGRTTFHYMYLLSSSRVHVMILIVDHILPCNETD